MFSLDTLAIILGLFASACFITMNYVLDKRLMLITQSFGMLSVGTQFGLKGIFGVTVINFIFIVRNLLVYSRDKRWDLNSSPTLFATSKRQERIKMGVAFLFVVSVVYFVVTPLNLESLTTAAFGIFLFPLLAAITNVLALAQQNLLPLKYWIVASTSCWVAFDLLVNSWTNLLGDVFSFIAGTVAIIRIVYVEKKNKLAANQSVSI